MTELLSHLDLAGYIFKKLFLFKTILADIARVGILHFGKSVIIPVSLGGYHEYVYDRNKNYSFCQIVI